MPYQSKSFGESPLDDMDGQWYPDDLALANAGWSHDPAIFQSCVTVGELGQHSESASSSISWE